MLQVFEEYQKDPNHAVKRFSRGLHFPRVKGLRFRIIGVI